MWRGLPAWRRIHRVWRPEPESERISMLKSGSIVRRLLPLLVLGLAGVRVFAGNPEKPQPTYWKEETLDYTINWPSGLSLGEGHIRTSRGTAGKWRVEMAIDASIPGFAVLDEFKSVVTNDFCTTESEKIIAHGRRKANESTTFDQQNQKATRKTKEGGKTEITTGACGKDALTFLQFVRRELREGRIPSSQTIYFGASYTVKLEFLGSRQIRLGDSMLDTERLQATITGPASKTTAELFFEKSPARVPVLVKVPFALGTFSMELAR